MIAAIIAELTKPVKMTTHIQGMRRSAPCLLMWLACPSSSLLHRHALFLSLARPGLGSRRRYSGGRLDRAIPQVSAMMVSLPCPNLLLFVMVHCTLNLTSYHDS